MQFLSKSQEILNKISLNFGEKNFTKFLKNFTYLKKNSHYFKEIQT